MKITLNFDTKEVSPQGECNLKELVKVLKKSVPDWKKWKVVQDVVFTYYPSYPIITYDYNNFDYNKWTIDCNNTGDTTSINNLVTLTS